MIELVNLIKSYEKGQPVLKGVSLTIPDGCVFGLVGINGAGKSTLLRLISGVLRADGGQICIDGESAYENERVKKGMFFLPDDPYYTSNLTAKALAETYRAVYDFDETSYYKYLKIFKLNPKKPIRNFSKGMKRQVFVALAFAIKPKYLLLDEAFDGLDPLARLVLKKELISLVQEKGTTVIISSHSLRELEDICTEYGILDNGEILSVNEKNSENASVWKFQLAIDKILSREEIGIECLSFSQVGKVVRLTARGEKEEILQKLQALEPLFVEEIQADFEERFIDEVQARGYLV